MEYIAAMQDMSIEQLTAVIEVLQKSSDSYFYIMDLDDDIYIVTHQMLKRFPFADTVTKDARRVMQDVIVYPNDYPKLREDSHSDRQSHPA